MRCAESGILPGRMRHALRSSLLDGHGIRHAFFTRLGGVSQPPYDTLNFSTSTGDSAEAVTTNLRRAAVALGVDVERVYFLNQVHGCDLRILEGDEDRRQMMSEKGDITVAIRAGIACGVRTADCVAVLLADRDSGAVAAVHSGWRGTAQAVAVAGVRALRDLIGGRGRLLAAVGPHIERCCFEVGEDVAAELAGASALGEAIIELPQPPGSSEPADAAARPHVDLRRIVEDQLRRAGVDEVDHVMGCTVCQPQRFHSYRRDGKIGGRMLAAVVSGTKSSLDIGNARLAY